MLTWLDWYIRDAADHLGPLGVGLDDITAMSLMITTNLQRGGYRQYPDLGMLHSAILPFLYTDGAESTKRALDRARSVRPNIPDGMVFGRGIQPSSDLVRALIGNRAGTEVVQSALQAMSSATYYIDLPHRSLRLTDETQIRALFVQPSAHGHFGYVAVLTAPGGNKMVGRYAWHTGEGGKVYGDSLTSDGDVVRQYVEDFTHLLLAYREFASDLVSVNLPRYTPQDLDALPKKRRKSLRNRATLFQIVSLQPPAGRFGKKREEDAAGGWKLTHKVNVRGHFRWQPYGPGRSLRKLIWIAAHTRGAGRSKPALDKVDLV